VGRLSLATRPRTIATSLYAGRGLLEAKAAAEAVGGGLLIVSAGLGLIDGDQLIPSYSLTLAAGDPDCIATRISGDFSPTAWWQALRKALGATLALPQRYFDRSRGLLLAALPGSYLSLVAADLAALPQETLSRLRLIGAPRATIPPQLLAYWMPYDTRFDGEGGPLPGTRGDFAQRAARHFAERVAAIAPTAAAPLHAEMVERSLSALSAPSPQPRAAGSDEELVAVIRGLIPRSNGRSGETLRLLRREAGRACEQRRFRRLFAIATGREATT
jgi:hypothetical protein